MMQRLFPRLLAMWLLSAALGGCASWLGSGDAGDHPTVYSPIPQMAADPAWPQVAGSLLIATPSAAPMLDGTRIVVRASADGLQFLRSARWARPAPEMLQDALLHLLEDAGTFAAVARQGSAIAADWMLLMELRRFEAYYSHSAVPSIELVVSAKLVHRQNQSIIASCILTHSEPAAASSTDAIISAFSHSLQQLVPQLAGWVLHTTTPPYENNTPHE